tara:strand:- start:241 stop:426 length:186 start_codon:yes stop_codon:yes gene_type:complete
MENVKVSKEAIKSLIAGMREGIAISDKYSTDSNKGYAYALGYAQGTLKQAISDLNYMIGND